MTTFLIVRFSSIGDIILTTPLLRMIKKQIPDARIIYFTKKQNELFLATNPYIDKIFSISKSEKITSVIHEIKKENIDYVIDLHNNLRSRITKLLIHKKSFTFNKLNFKKWLLVNLKIDVMPNVHIVDRYLATLQHFNIKNDRLGLEYYIPPTDKLPASYLPEAMQNGYVALVIGAMHKTKQLTAEKIATLCTITPLPIVLLGGKDEQSKAQTIVALTENKNIVNVCGKLNLNQSASVVKNSRVVITHDTGLMHIAAAFQKPIITVWGNTVPELGMYPYLPNINSINFQVADLKCRPCSKIGFSQCPKKHFNCIEKQDLSAIAAKTIELFNANNNTASI